MWTTGLDHARWISLCRQQGGYGRRVDVAALCREVFGDGVRKVRGTSSPAAYFVELPARTVVAKLPAPGRPGSALAEAYAYRRAADNGARVPGVLAVSTDPECVFIEKLTGDSLWSKRTARSNDLTAWRQAGADLRAIHEILVEGFGPLTGRSTPANSSQYGDGEPGDIAVRGQAAEWCPFVSYTRSSGIRVLVDAGCLPASHAALLERRYDEVADDISACTDGRLLHGDLEGGHVFTSAAGTYEGIIDFGQAQAGDPRWDLARLPLWDGDEALNAALDGYGRDALAGTDRDLLLPLYLFAFVVNFAVHRLGVSGADAGIREHLQMSGYDALL